MNWERKIKKTAPPMTQARALRLIKKHRPTCQADANEIGLSLRFIGSGCFREVWRISGTNLIIKFAESSDFEMSRDHAEDEMKQINRLAKFKSLREHLPKIYYYDKKSGTTVAEYYECEVAISDFCDKVPEILGKIIKELTGLQLTDAYRQNMRLVKDRRGWRTLKFIDLGC